MSKLKFLKLFAIMILISFLYINNEEILTQLNNNIENPIDNYSFEKEDMVIKYGQRENLTNDIEIIFCPSDDCYYSLKDELSDAEDNIRCAFYEFDNLNLSKIIAQKSLEGIDISLIVDDNYLFEEGLKELSNTQVRTYSDIDRGTRYNNYMHHKFCIIDNETLITGSMNPTQRGTYMNNNNFLIIDSKYLSRNYLNEFGELKEGRFGYNKEKVTEYESVELFFDNESYRISSYMCPQDDCSKKIVDILNKSENEIIFATFVLTHDDIKDILIEKSDDVKIRGVIESRNVNLKGSDILELRDYFELKDDENKYNMHHKFFVVDNRYVITGSMNPSASGDDYNDENILIIDSEKIANLYKKEFENLYN